jgi:hypothetical protein
MSTDFIHWVMGRLTTKLKTWLTILLALLVLGVFLLPSFSQSLFFQTNLPLIPLILNLLVIVAISLRVATRHPLTHDKFPRESEVVIRFYRAWALIWLVWMLPYLMLLFDVTWGMTQGYQDLYGRLWRGPVLNLLNNIHSALFLFCFHLLSPVAAMRLSTEMRKHKINDLSRQFLFILFLLVLMLFLVEIEVRLFLFDRPDIGQVFSVASSILAGFSISLLVGRFQDQRFGVSPVVIGSLYLMGILQVLYLTGGTVAISVIQALMIPLKVILFLSVHWLLQSGRLIYYFYRTSASFLFDNDRASFLASLSKNAKGVAVDPEGLR